MGAVVNTAHPLPGTSLTITFEAWCLVSPSIARSCCALVLRWKDVIIMKTIQTWCLAILTFRSLTELSSFLHLRNGCCLLDEYHDELLQSSMQAVPANLQLCDGESVSSSLYQENIFCSGLHAEFQTFWRLHFNLQCTVCKADRMM